MVEALEEKVIEVKVIRHKRLMMKKQLRENEKQQNESLGKDKRVSIESAPVLEEGDSRFAEDVTDVFENLVNQQNEGSASNIEEEQLEACDQDDDSAEPNFEIEAKLIVQSYFQFVLQDVKREQENVIRARNRQALHSLTREEVCKKTEDNVYEIDEGKLLLWWRMKAYQWPDVGEVFLWSYSRSSGTARTESIFSVAGAVEGDKRKGRMNAKQHSARTYLKANYNLIIDDAHQNLVTEYHDLLRHPGVPPDDSIKKFKIALSSDDSTLAKKKREKWKIKTGEQTLGLVSMFEEALDCDSANDVEEHNLEDSDLEVDPLEDAELPM